MSSFYALFSITFIILLCINDVLSVEQDYYWREYTGDVHPDAVSGGKDINGKDIYIGQAYIRNEGLIVVHIYPGVKELMVPIKGVKKTDSGIKILCGPQQNFYWLPATNTNLHLTLIGKHAVIGGHEDGGGFLNIGRISHQGEIKIGKIASFKVENANFYYVDRNNERMLKSYEILVYAKKDIDLRRIK